MGLDSQLNTGPDGVPVCDDKTSKNQFGWKRPQFLPVTAHNTSSHDSDASISGTRFWFAKLNLINRSEAHNYHHCHHHLTSYRKLLLAVRNRKEMRIELANKLPRQRCDTTQQQSHKTTLFTKTIEYEHHEGLYHFYHRSSLFLFCPVVTPSPASRRDGPITCFQKEIWRNLSQWKRTML